MNKLIRVLIAEDSEDDALLIMREMKRAGYDLIFERVDSAEGMKAALTAKTWDLVLSDHTMPQFNSFAALRVLQETGLDLPFIIVSGKIGEEMAVAAMKAGASDYILKDNLARLAPAIERELREVEVRRERTRAEEALRKSEERFRDLYDHAPVGYHEYDSEGRITTINQTDLEMLGYTREEIIGRYIWELNVEGENLRSQVLAKLAGALPPARALECTYRRKDGTIFLVLIEDRLIRDEERRIIGIRSTIQDITEQKRADEDLRNAEEKYRNIFENAVEGIFQTTLEGRYLSANPALALMLGYDSPEELMESVTDTTSQQYVDPDRRLALRHQLEEMGMVKDFETHFYRKDGSVIWVSMNIRAVRDESDRVLYYEGTTQDITERKKAEKRMAALQDQFRQAQKMEAIGKLAGGIAHDFNNLLTIIKGYSHLTSTELEEGNPLRENIEEVQRAADRASDLTHQILAFSRRQVMEMKILELNVVLTNIEKMLRRIIGEDIELVMFLAKDLVRVKTDPGQMDQVIMNLAVNARDAMPGGGKLTIETANVELDEAYARAHIAVTPGPYVMLSVSDTGVGMTSDIRDRVFEPFFTTKDKGKGTGLGLSTVYGIVKQSGGNIWIYSEPGRGTTFKIYLPQVDEPFEETGKKEGPKKEFRGSETLLVVEDEKEVRKLAVRVLRDQGYKVLESSGGSDVLEICKTYREPIHLMITDVVMPEISGREVANQIKLIHPETKVVYMSGYTDNAIVHHGILNSGFDYIQKPFTVEGLTKRVRELLDK